MGKEKRVRVKEERKGSGERARFTDQSETAELHVFHLHIAALYVRRD